MLVSDMLCLFKPSFEVVKDGGILKSGIIPGFQHIILSLDQNDYHFWTIKILRQHPDQF